MTTTNEDSHYNFYDFRDTLNDLRKDLIVYGNIEFAAIYGKNIEDNRKEILGYMPIEDMDQIDLLDDDYYEVMRAEDLLAALEQQA